MKCPKCKKGILKEEVSTKGIFKKYKVYTFFCPLCDYEKKKEIRISQADFNKEMLHGHKKEAKVEIGGIKIKSKER